MENYQQLTIWNQIYPKKRIIKPIRLIELFAGIGSQAKSLEVLGVPFEHYKICEWAIPSIAAYNAIHLKDFADYSKDKTKEEMLARINGVSADYNNQLSNLEKKPIDWIKKVYNSCIATHNLVNIMNVHGQDLEIVDTDKYEYILTYSFPCQDLSLAGKRAGMEISQADGGTRSGLLWEVERILDELGKNNLPQILLMENVPEVIGSKNISSFQKWELNLSQLGYTNYCEILNAKDFGIPQNRRRCFMISILGNFAYDFPVKMPLEYRLKDFLEKEVDERFYLSDKATNGVLNTSYSSSKLENRIGNNGIMPTICARDYKDPKLAIVDIQSSLGHKAKSNGEILPTLSAQSQSKYGVVKQSLKHELCNQLIRQRQVKENDVIRHSYTKSRMKGEMKDIQENNISPTLDTRCDCLGVVEKIVRGGFLSKKPQKKVIK